PKPTTAPRWPSSAAEPRPLRAPHEEYPMSTTPRIDPVDQRLETGLQDVWHAVCPSGFIKERPVSLRRFGYRLALWRGADGQVHALEDRCPHRGAPLSQGVTMGDRLSC